MSVVSPPANAFSPDQGATSEPPILRPLLAVAGFGAAAIHFGFAPMHLQTSTVQGAFFLTVAWLQLGVALAIIRKPSPLAYRLAIVVNATVIAVWIMSRTVGINGEVEPFGFPDSLAAALQAFIVIGSFGPLTRRLPQRPLREATAGALLGAFAMAVAGLASVSMVPSLSGHGEGSGHSHGGTEVAGASPAADAGAHAHTPAVAVPYDPELPIDLSGTPGVTPKQQADAEDLVARTLVGLPQWTDQKVAEAAGFRSIGDSGTGTEHLVNQAFMDDDTILDPNVPESLVYDVNPDGTKTLAAAMYMLKTGTPLAEAPKTGGALMQWHIHNNLCYNAKGKVAGLTNADGTCPEGLVLPPETPMIHVWIRQNECGPFAALEGVGAGNIADGETRLCDSAHGV